jgi:4a-hydroxytetrahydrobiopterin dehydratase
LDIPAVRPFWKAVFGYVGESGSDGPADALHRAEAALAAGGRLLSDQRAPAFWVLADPEGNEVCVTTWQGRQS